MQLSVHLHVEQSELHVRYLQQLVVGYPAIIALHEHFSLACDALHLVGQSSDVCQQIM